MSLVPTLNVQKDGRKLAFSVTVHNAGSEAAELRFTDAGLLQIVVTTPDGAHLYDSRAGRMFAAVMKSVTVAPGKDVTFGDAWEAPPNVRTLHVQATVRAIPPLTARCIVEVGAS